MLNSSLVALPPNRRALKRSASTASLPSPPRTHRKHARGRSRGSCDSDSDDNIALSSDEEEQEHRHKKRRTGETAAADEEAFWLGGAPQATTSSKNDAGSSTSTSKAQAAPLLYRKRAAQSQRTDVAPMSPPPSHRKTTTVTPKFSGATASPPRTPQTRSSTKRARALRDSPDNPFLATPVEDSDTPGLSASSANPSPSTPSYDKPTISLVLYVFSLSVDLLRLLMTHITAVALDERTRTRITTMQRADLCLLRQSPSYLSSIQTTRPPSSARPSCCLPMHAARRARRPRLRKQQAVAKPESVRPRSAATKARLRLFGR